MTAAPDFAGHRIVLIQAGPCAYLAAIETEWGEELGRSRQPLHSPQAALSLALDSIAAQRAKGCMP